MHYIVKCVYIYESCNDMFSVQIYNGNIYQTDGDMKYSLE